MRRRLRPLPFSGIRITDSLFGEYVKKVSEVIIPHQWKILNNQIEDTEPSYCIQNFRIAAGEEEGERKGVVFLDTDLYKWLEAVAFCLAAGEGKEYEPLADEAIGLIGRAQEEDGYLNTYFTVNAPNRKWKNLTEGHELYTAGHMIEAATAYYTATGKRPFLDIAKKNADLICRTFGTGKGQIHGYPGHQEIEVALVKLYRVTGEEKYLDTAEYFIRERGKEPNYLLAEMAGREKPEFFPEFQDYDLKYSQAHVSPLQQDTAEGHAVRVMYMCAAMADIAEERKDAEMLEACIRIWNNAVKKRMYITGGIGSSGHLERFTTDYDLPNRTNYSETCASIGLMMTGQRLASATGDAAYYEVVEQALYNTVLAGINIRGDRYFYVNPLEVIPEFCTEHTYMSHVKPVRQKWYGVACCPPNVARTLASLGQYIYAEDEEAVYVHQFISSSAQAPDKGDLKLYMESELLRTGRVEIRTKADRETLLKVRIPSYAGEWTLEKNGEPVESLPVEKGYVTLSVPAGQTVFQFDFQIRPQWMYARNEVQEDTGKTALVKGPLVYCLEEADNGNLLSQVYVDADVPVREEAPAEGLAGEVPVLEYEGYRLKTPDMGEDLYGTAKPVSEKVTLKAVPYCMWGNRKEGEMLVWQKLRIS